MTHEPRLQRLACLIHVTACSDHSLSLGRESRVREAFVSHVSSINFSAAIIATARRVDPGGV